MSVILIHNYTVLISPHFKSFEFMNDHVICAYVYVCGSDTVAVSKDAVSY